MMATEIREAVRNGLMILRNAYLRHIWGYRLHPSAVISFKAYLDRTYPRGVCIGADTIITRGVTILSHDFARQWRTDTIIGSRCMIGVNAVVLPGVTIGDEVVIGAGAVVTRNIDSNSLAVGNPARIVRRVRTGRFGRIIQGNPRMEQAA